MDCTVFDVETASSRRDSICSMGIIRCEGGRIVYEKEIRIYPGVAFDPRNTMIHGITESDVEDEPAFPEVWKEISGYFDRTVLVAHNAKSMDLCALYRTLERYGLPRVSNDYICTLELARKIFKNDETVNSCGLDALSRMYGIALPHHHNALDDARACLGILKKFRQFHPDMVLPQHYAPK